MAADMHKLALAYDAKARIAEARLARLPAAPTDPAATDFHSCTRQQMGALVRSYRKRAAIARRARAAAT